MWLKVFLLLAYIGLLFILSRMLEAVSWSENGYSGILSRQLLDPMVISVAKLRALLEQRGVSYEGVVEKSELTSLVNSSGPVSAEEVAMAQMDSAEVTETNFTCGAHFIEQVEDAKDSVWLVQVVRHSGQLRIVGDMRWKTIRKKVSKFGVRTGLLDCSLDYRYCSQKGWHSPFLLLALPSEFEKKASIAMHNYSGPVHETVVMRWVRDKLSQRVVHIRDPDTFRKDWQGFTNNPFDPEIRAILFTNSESSPLFYSALTVKFPGRVKFGMVSLRSKTKKLTWKQALGHNHLPSYIIYSTERNYTYGTKPGEVFSFASMELFLRFLYPCLNDIFIISFCAANIMSLFEFFVSNCGFLRRIVKCVWCVVKYNIIVIMLWLPIIGIFQMPFLDRVPLIALKLQRMITTSQMGTVFRGDFSFFQNHPVYIYISFLVYLASVTYLCRKYRQEEEEPEGWFTFSHPANLVHLRPNNLLEPMGLNRYNFLARLDVLGSRLSQQSLWLQPTISMDYIQHLQTWRYCPRPLGEAAAENVTNVKVAMGLTEGHKAPCRLGANLDVEGARGFNPQSDAPTSELKRSKSMERDCPEASCTVFSSAELDDSSPFLSEAVVTPASRLCLCPGHSEPQYLSQGRTAQSGEQAAPESSPAVCHIHSSRSTSLSDQSSASLTAVSSSTQQPDDSSPPMSSASSTGTSAVGPPGLPTKNSPSSTSSQASGAFPSSTSSQELKGFPTGYIMSHQCVICLEDYLPLVMLCGLPCGHVFHETCIITWLNTEKHFCPMCRWPSYQVPSPH